MLFSWVFLSFFATDNMMSCSGDEQFANSGMCLVRHGSVVNSEALIGAVKSMAQAGMLQGQVDVNLKRAS